MLAAFNTNIVNTILNIYESRELRHCRSAKQRNNNRMTIFENSKFELIYTRSNNVLSLAMHTLKIKARIFQAGIFYKCYITSRHRRTWHTADSFLFSVNYHLFLGNIGEWFHLKVLECKVFFPYNVCYVRLESKAPVSFINFNQTKAIKLLVCNGLEGVREDEKNKHY